MVVNNRSFAILYSLLPLAVACHSNMKDSDLSTGNQLIDQKYLYETPMVQIKDMPIITESTKPFSLEKDTKVQLYATGEMDIALASMPREYYFKSDDIELFFDKGEQSNNENATNSGILLIYSWLDGKAIDNSVHFIKDHVEYTSIYDTKERSYKTIIKIPWDKLARQELKTNDSLAFDIAVGDNDDGMKQKAKIAWHSTSDPLYSKNTKLGRFFLVDANTAIQKKSGEIYAIRKELGTELNIFDWGKAPSFKIANLVAGEIKDTTDLSAEVRSCWDEHYLYLNVTILDSRKGFARPETVIASKTFHDYGWIEDEKGEVIWQMHALHSKHAGGAIKNQEIGTCLELKKGKYFLKYITDESHSWNNWDDKAPRNNFYGIVIYNYK